MFPNIAEIFSRAIWEPAPSCPTLGLLCSLSYDAEGAAGPHRQADRRRIRRRSWRFIPRWTRPLAAVFVSLQVYQVLANVFPGPPLNGGSWPQPPEVVVAPIVLGSCLYAQIYRYRRVSGPVQRQQTKWAVFGLSTALTVAVLINNVLGPLLPPLVQPGSLPNLAVQTIGGAIC
jgi:hypothetical protein